MSIYDTARDLKLPGAVVSAHIDPTKITPRIKKMVQTMLRNGKLKGGWSSQSFMLARKLLESKNLPVLQGWNSRFRCRPLTDADLAQFDEWFEADVALEKMKMNASQRDSVWYLKRFDANLAENKRAIRNLTHRNLIPFYVRIDNDPIKVQVHDKLLELRLPKDIAALNEVADLLDAPTPIPLRLAF
jgi:hypothetical protein